MKLRHAAGLAALIAEIAALPVSSQAAPQTCPEGKTTPASYTWNFQAEASRLLNGIEVDAAKAQHRADRLQQSSLNEDLAWQFHATRLAALKREVNDMGRRLCRLEQIRRVAAPWQQKAIDDAASSVRLMADNVQDAINFLEEHQDNFWEPAYRHNVSNVFHESGQLFESVRNLEQGARVSSTAGRS